MCTIDPSNCWPSLGQFVSNRNGTLLSSLVNCKPMASAIRDVYKLKACLSHAAISFKMIYIYIYVRAACEKLRGCGRDGLCFPLKEGPSRALFHVPAMRTGGCSCWMTLDARPATLRVFAQIACQIQRIKTVKTITTIHALARLADSRLGHGQPRRSFSLAPDSLLSKPGRNIGN